ncbi:transglycosylase SLT domain-containing protein [Falsirhodobacter xinxiangensis]|uniref:transglycosylase SLT domain-containing protein n=1 Tax=Falsirhodobacter xinxiangensis TaxID=2530049 RepID=UPI0010AAC96D|nr:transglycosylase SLT domain-containing protein [Rhodobacter xinxiangensis]
MQAKTLFLGALLALPISCGATSTTSAPVVDTTPAMRWDFRPEAKTWTATTLDAIGQKDLTSLVPSDIETWCPGYENASETDRQAFWSGILSALAKHESTWNPQASGGGGKWIGLTQIAPSTARAYGCEATSTGALKNGAANLSCAVEIAAVQVSRDNMVAGGGNRGLGRDWAPFRSDAKRSEMAAWTRSQSYCRA